MSVFLNFFQTATASSETIDLTNEDSEDGGDDVVITPEEVAAELKRIQDLHPQMGPFKVCAVNHEFNIIEWRCLHYRV